MTERVNISLPLPVMDYLLTVAWDALVQAASAVDKLDPKQNPETYPKAAADLRAAVQVNAELWNAERVDVAGLLPPAPQLSQVYEPAQLQAMRDGGLDPEKELGPHHPQASHPSCAHGRRFTEDCQHCARVDADHPLPENERAG